MPLVDLTQPFGEDMLVLPGMPQVVLRRIATIAVDGLNDSKVEFASHTGTHLDAPNHVFDDARSIDQVRLDELCGPAVGWACRSSAPWSRASSAARWRSSRACPGPG